MERRLNKKFETYITEFKHSILERSRELDFDEKEKVSDLLRHIYDYDRLQFDKEDLNKRKRVKFVELMRKVHHTDLLQTH